MSILNLTRHAILRMAQRSIRLGDLEIIDFLGTEVEGGAILLRKDAQAFEREAKKVISQVWRLVGKRSVTDRDIVITAYHATRAKVRWLLRSTDDRTLSR